MQTMQSSRQLLPTPPKRERSPLEPQVREYLSVPRLNEIARAKLGDADYRKLHLTVPQPGPYLDCDLALEGVRGDTEQLQNSWRDGQWRLHDQALEEKLEAVKAWKPTAPPGEALDYCKHIMGVREGMEAEARAWRREQTIGEPPNEFAWCEDREVWMSPDGEPCSGKPIWIAVHIALDLDTVDDVARRRSLSPSIVLLHAELDDETALYFERERALCVVLGPEFNRIEARHTRRAPEPLIV